jgi:hypothetical protein
MLKWLVQFFIKRNVLNGIGGDNNKVFTVKESHAVFLPSFLRLQAKSFLDIKVTKIG